METLDALLSMIFVARQNIHARHFNVTGVHFTSLHKTFEEAYEMLDDWYDKIGELCRRQKMYAIHNIPDMYKISEIKSDDGILPDGLMVSISAMEIMTIKTECEKIVNSGLFDNATVNDLSQFASDLSLTWYRIGSINGDTLPD